MNSRRCVCAENLFDPRTSIVCFCPGLLNMFRCLAWLFSVLLFSSSVLMAQEATMATGTVFLDDNQNGTFDIGEQILPDVPVSNGRQVVKTDSNGRYSLPVGNDTIIFVIKPTGYRTRMDRDHLSRFYYIHKPDGSPKELKFPGVDPTGPLPKSIDFPLYRQAESPAFDVIFFGDPQPRDVQALSR